jgi:hypothetical protein
MANEVRVDGRTVGGKQWQENIYNREGMKEAPANGKESSHSAHGNGMNEERTLKRSFKRHMFVQYPDLLPTLNNSNTQAEKYAVMFRP